METVDALDAVLTDSATRPVLIFKHSVTCGTSAMAMEEIRDLVGGPAIGADVYVVTVQTARLVAKAIETRLGLRHESPQLLLVVDGRVVWHASHFRVSAAAALAAVRQHTVAALIH
jgi:bacillithiol system protein YtxJ